MYLLRPLVLMLATVAKTAIAQANGVCCNGFCCTENKPGCCENKEESICRGEGYTCCDRPDDSTGTMRTKECVAVPAGTLKEDLLTIPAPTASLNVYALPVGQGDCTIIQCPNGNLVVVDCGSSSNAGWSAQQVQTFLQGSINNVVAVVISHNDSDHFSYFPKIVWNTNNIQRIIVGGSFIDYIYNTAIRNWLNNFGFYPNGKVRNVTNGQSCIGDCSVPGGTNFCSNANIQFKILAANNGPNNQKSIVMKVITVGWSILLPGDIEGAAATAIATRLGATLQSTVYKMAHHGASTSANLPTWLRPIRPSQAFASNAYNFGRYRHPRCVTINRLLNLNSIIPATPHPLYCGNSSPAPPTPLDNFCHSVYATAPTATQLCLITSSSNGQIQQNCMQAATFITGLENVVDDECEGFRSEGSRALVARINYNAIAILFVAYFLCTL